jgi:hypothetical protein
MSNNNLKILDGDHFKNNRKIEKIWLNNNEIQYLSPSMFDNMKNLLVVDLRDNQCISDGYCINNKYCGRRFSEMKKIIDKNC